MTDCFVLKGFLRNFELCLDFSCCCVSSQGCKLEFSICVELIQSSSAEPNIHKFDHMSLGVKVLSG